MKLSKAQREVLEKMATGWVLWVHFEIAELLLCEFQERISIATFRALKRKGTIILNEWYDEYCRFELTPTGKAAVAKKKG